jgi:universal stress protein E
LTFLSALSLSPEALQFLEDDERERLAETVEARARAVLDGLVKQASAKGIAAASKFVLGSGWLELIRQVLRERHDLLLIGTRDRYGLGRMIFGSEALKLVRRCPCPVWVNRDAPPTAETGEHPLTILLASDLSAVSEEALRLAVSLAGAINANLHLLHVLDYPLDRIWATTLDDPLTVKYHRDVRAAAEEQLRRQVQQVTPHLKQPIALHLVDGTGFPDDSILRFIHDYRIDLLVMGTIARSGLPGIMIGNTAERLLPEVACSVLAVKPLGFHTPVRLEA